MTTTPDDTAHACDWPGCAGQCHTGPTCPCHAAAEHLPCIKFERNGLPYLACTCDWDDRGDVGWADHPLAADTAPLDVERLVEAVHNWHNPSAYVFKSVCQPGGRCRAEAAAIAAEYARLAETP